MDFINNPPQILISAGYILLYLVMFFFSKWLKGMFSTYNLDEQLTQYDNNAVSVSVAGYFIGVTTIFIGAIGGDSGQSVGMEFLTVTGYCLGGIFLLHLSRVINRKLILNKFSVDKEIINDQNAGTGVVEAATYIASGLIIAGSIYGEGGGPWVTLVFYAIGQVCMVLFSLLYVQLTPYSVHDEIEKDNTAAGLGFAGGLISIGIIVMHAVSGVFNGWKEDLISLGKDILIVFVYLIVVRIVFDRFVLRNSNLTTEIAKDRNIGAGLLEMIVAICFSAVLYFVI
ncbi:MAG: DUF350 domain-containing protein [Bacteroidia bacterium]|nr:DUF350 domain-containing protein [Bacteroidia bacterium]